MLIPDKTMPSMFWSAALTGTLIWPGGWGQSAQANSDSQPEPQQSGDPLISLKFEAPGDPVPPASAGGGVRGRVQFAAPDDSVPRTASGGTRGVIQFHPPGEAAPNATPNATADATRGEVQFDLPGESAPPTTGSGGTRGNVQFDTPNGEPIPRTTASGGTRGQPLPELTAVLPMNQYGRTISARPTFFVYVPPMTSRVVFFSLQDQHRQHHYQTMLTISGQGGLVSVTLPADAPELELDKNYAWFFAPVDLNGRLRPDNYGVSGWIKRVAAADLNAIPASLSPVERATEYAKSGVWYDTLDVLVAAQLEQPEDLTLTSEWYDLLEQVGLEAIATQPIAEQL
ncbi:MAG: DUF928 domain-containing protein [Cyanothece sp. SIO1E1]|nr:DUF928 domain-containing protein [Cyanothece sp. SIO1E1]